MGRSFQRDATHVTHFTRLRPRVSGAILLRLRLRSGWCAEEFSNCVGSKHSHKCFWAALLRALDQLNGLLEKTHSPRRSVLGGTVPSEWRKLMLSDVYNVSGDVRRLLNKDPFLQHGHAAYLAGWQQRLVM